jgi:Pentapeptide repeats (8 copies)
MRSLRTTKRPGLLRLAAGIVVAGPLLVAFATQSQAATNAIASSHQASASKWCENVGDSAQNLAVNSKSEALSAAKLLVRFSSNAPNATLKKNLKTLGNRLSSAAASYPRLPSKATTASDEKLEKKVESEISSACSGVGASGGEGNANSSGSSGSSSRNASMTAFCKDVQGVTRDVTTLLATSKNGGTEVSASQLNKAASAAQRLANEAPSKVKQDAEALAQDLKHPNSANADMLGDEASLSTDYETDCSGGIAYNSGSGNSGFGNSGSGNSGFGNSGSGNSGFGNSGSGNSGFGNSGSGNSGFGNSGSGNSGDTSDSGNTGIFGN